MRKGLYSPFIGGYFDSNGLFGRLLAFYMPATAAELEARAGTRPPPCQLRNGVLVTTTAGDLPGATLGFLSGDFDLPTIGHRTEPATFD